jgi:hypothetical protein
MTDRTGLKIIDVALNDVNGGSFAVTVAKSEGPYSENRTLVNYFLAQEERAGLVSRRPYQRFADRILRHRERLRSLIRKLKMGGLVLGYGASTKGNVILQFCEIGPDDIPYIADVNDDKFGCSTPGSRIPIISEMVAHAMKPSYFLVLPWHFREGIIKREKIFLEGGGKMLFPLPEIEVIVS